MTNVYKCSPYDLIHKLDQPYFEKLNPLKEYKETFREHFKVGNFNYSESNIYSAFHNTEITEIKPYMLLYIYKGNKSKYNVRVGKRTNGKSIDELPIEAKGRVENKAEGDLIVGKKGTKGCALTICRVINNESFTFKIPNRETSSVVNALDEIEKKIGLDRFRALFWFFI
jgi:IS30 family transposase